SPRAASSPRRQFRAIPSPATVSTGPTSRSGSERCSASSCSQALLQAQRCTHDAVTLALTPRSRTNTRPGLCPTWTLRPGTSQATPVVRGRIPANSTQLGRLANEAREDGVLYALIAGQWYEVRAALAGEAIESAESGC